ncbi:hypothetical protein [Actinoplanes sp. NBRC 101535]|uniref:hypothetical protein n=1 Tax=Actinoplanes sp. NBRC 101535 TaxID=3032196 RepID=UPI0024A1B74F|nr:hypothetical protein [Actinoplanes sp. NBRC 101535]GLY00965.1 hypothetical protein Acsp01_13440 [Actinoplanes sp. NBRC 101535]
MLIPKLITGLRWNDFHFTTVVPFHWVIDNIVSGLVLEDALRDIGEGLSVDPRAEQLAPLRKKIQRPFRKEVTERRSVGGRSVPVRRLVATRKLENTRNGLRDYLLNTFALTPQEAFGALPGFYAVWPERMPERAAPVSVDGLDSPWYTYDHGQIGRGALADGECRHQAGFDIQADPRVPAALKDKLMQQPVTVEIFHGITAEQASVLFVDLNYEGTPVDAITKANLDTRNKWITVTKEIFDDLKIGYATTGRQLTITHQAMNQWILLTHAEQMVKAIVLGPYKPLTTSKKTPPWEGVDFDRLRAAATRWFTEIFAHFGGVEVLTDKSRVIRTIAVRVALASLGSAFYHRDEKAMEEARRTLHDINWIVSKEWNGIGGKVVVSEDGVATMSAGSGKESITRAVQAITKPDTVAGRAVRSHGHSSRTDRIPTSTSPAATPESA